MPASSAAVPARTHTIGASGPGGTGPAGRTAAHSPRSAGSQTAHLSVAQVASQGVLYVSAAGNDGNSGWTAPWRGVSRTVAGISGMFEDVGSGSVLQHFTLQPGETLKLTFQWYAAFL